MKNKSLKRNAVRRAPCSCDDACHKHVMQAQKSWRVWTAIFIVSLFYLSYRYPFQLNDAGTSPTYHATPTFIQAGKYVILGTLWLPAASISFFTPSRRSQPAMIGATLLMFLYPLVMEVVGHDTFAASSAARPFELFKIGFPFLFMGLMANETVARRESGEIAKWLMRFCWISMIFDLVQVILFITIHRLPALAYSSGYTVRFGGLWDDPNAFPGVFAFAIPFVIMTNKFSVATLSFIIFAIGALISTQSLTGLAATVAALGFVGFIYALFVARGAGRRFAIIAASSGFIIMIIGFLALQSFLAGAFDSALGGWMREKLPSIMSREGSYRILEAATPATFGGFAPTGLFGENGWINISVNMGIPYAVAYIFIGIWAGIGLIRAGIQETLRKRRAIWFSLLSYLVWYLASMINIPQAEVFPVNIIFGIIAGTGISVGVPVGVFQGRPKRIQTYAA